MPVDTDTRLIPPAAARARIESLADHPATKPSPRPKTDSERARPVVVPEYSGRHRTTDDVETRPISAVRVSTAVDPAGSWMPGEGATRLIPLPEVAPAAEELPAREAGVALHSAGDAGLLASVLGAAHRLRGKLLRGDR